MVFVTHHVALCLPGADYLVVLENGHVEQACPAYDAQVDNFQRLETEKHIDEPVANAEKAKEPVPGDEQAGHASRQVYTTEHASEGRVHTSHYKLVFNAAGGKLYWIGIALLYGLTASSDVIRPVFMRQWSSDPNPAHLDYYLGIWFIIIGITVTLGAFRWVWLYGMTFGRVRFGFYSRGSKIIHSKLLTRVLNAPLGFFESTPTGRLINIFSQDIYRLDAQVADAFGRESTLQFLIGSD